MASIDGNVERDEEAGVIYSDNQNRRLLNSGNEQPTEHHQNSDSGNEQPTEHHQKNRALFLKCYKLIPQPIRYLLKLLLFVCLAVVAYAGVTVATIAILPLILTMLVVARLLQFVIRCEVFDKHSVLKGLLRYWIIMLLLLILFEIGIFYPIAKYVPGVKLVVIIGLPITKWIKIICILIGIYLINQVFWFSISVLPRKVYTSNIYISRVNYFLKQKRAIVVEGASEIFGCILFLWAEVVVMNSIPGLKQSKIFGVYTREWVKVSVFVLIGYNIIALLAHMFVLFIPNIFGDHPSIGETLDKTLSFISFDGIANGAFNKKYVVYFAIGIKRSIIFILSAILLLLTWVLYFDDHLNTTSRDKRILEFGTWTCVSISICSFLWLIKSCILLYWETHTLYDGLHSKITEIGKQLYFLILLSHTNQVDHKINGGWALLKSNFKGEFRKGFARRSARDELINHIGPNASTYAIQQAAQYFLTAQYSLSKGSIPCNLDHLKINNIEENNLNTLETIPETGNPAHPQIHNPEENNAITKEILQKIMRDEIYPETDWKKLLELFSDKVYTWEEMTKELEKTVKCNVRGVVDVRAVVDSVIDWKMFLELLSDDVNTKEEISLQKVKKWMERANSRCMFLVNTLISEKDVVRCLNQVMSWLIFGVTFLIWLLLTGLATTKVLVLIASPLLAATFMFGDTCKSLFQGLIFVYVIHLFDVGDLCLVDEKLLEVKRISVWNTTFSKVRKAGKHQEVLYPNSLLATKNVINHKTNFDWEDTVEFSLSTSDKEMTKIMRKQIETYLDAAYDRFIPNFHSIEFLEIGEKAKIAVHIKHNVQTEGWTYFECLKEKERRRFEFVLDIQNLVNLHETKTETTPENSKAKDEEIIEMALAGPAQKGLRNRGPIR